RRGRLAMKAPCSVWMAPDGSDPRLRRILVPIDFSAASADVLDVAASLADLAGGSECLALHVYFNPAVTTFDEYDAVLRGQEQQSFAKLLESVDARGLEIEPLFVESANVPHAIERVAEERQCDLIVMGTRGRSRSSAILLGSETEQTIIETRKPLLAVKHFGSQLGLLGALLDKQVIGKKGPRFG
ncbi:MAG: universal stress protein, partial [Planctomycetaceae bacterium]